MDFKFYKIVPGPKPTLVPLVLSSIRAGFPNPADNFIDKKIDLNEHLITNAASTFLVRVEGDSMIEANLKDKDVLIVDRSINAKSGMIVVAIIDGEFTVKRLSILQNQTIELIPENKAYKKMVITPDMDFKVWGVVTKIIYDALARW